MVGFEEAGGGEGTGCEEARGGIGRTGGLVRVERAAVVTRGPVLIAMLCSIGGQLKRKETERGSWEGVP